MLPRKLCFEQKTSLVRLDGYGWEGLGSDASNPTIT
jgi:hypothetical protein